MAAEWPPRILRGTRTGWDPDGLHGCVSAVQRHFVRRGWTARDGLAWAHNPEVAGSNPAPATYSARFARIWPNCVVRRLAVLAGFSPEGWPR